MICKPCRVTFEGFRYEIRKDGSVYGVAGALRNEPTPKGAVYNDQVVEPGYPEMIRAEARRQRRNRNARERHEALTSLGLVRVRGNLGGTYYE